MNSIFRTFCGISAIVAAIVCISFLSGVYTYAGLLPILFLVFTFAVNNLKSIWEKRPLTSYVVTAMLWMRMVMLPFYGAVTGFYSVTGASLELSNHFIGAMVLCLYDCIAISLVLLFFSFQKDKTERSYLTGVLYGRQELYFIFVSIALVLYFAVGRSMHIFDFAIKPIAEDLEREGDLTGGRELIIRQIVGSGLMFLFFLSIWWLKKRYDRTKSTKYFYWSLFCSIFLVSIIAGERRTSQVYKAFASGYLLLSLYPSKRRKTVLFIGSAALFVLAAMTIYKQFYGFMYSSYAEAIQNASMSQGFSYPLLDAYFYGLDTIAKNIHIGQMMNVGFGQFLFDFFRNFFGFSFFVPSGRLLTSQMYNSIIYSGDQITGFLLSSVGYGYIFTGYVLAPLITVFNVVIMLFFEKCLMQSKTIEWQYIWAIAYMRFGFGVLGSTPPLINYVTRFLFVNCLIILFARMLKAKLR